MRISTSYEFLSYRRDIEAAQGRMFEAQRQVSTGKRFTQAEEDPYASQVVVQGTSLKRWIAQTDQNIRTAQDYLGTTEVAMGETLDGLRRAYMIAVRGANASATANERAALAQEIGTIQERLVDLANSRAAGGQFVFAGQDNQKKPFQALDGLVFSGDTLGVFIETDPANLQKVNLTDASSFFLKAYQRLSDLKNHLGSNDPGTIGSHDIGQIDAAIQDALSLQAETGYRLENLQKLKDRHAVRSDDLTAMVSDAEDVDVAEAVTKLRLAETTYQAALQSVAAATRMRLMDFLR